jgi:hypothetical protein
MLRQGQTFGLPSSLCSTSQLVVHEPMQYIFIPRVIPSVPQKIDRHFGQRHSEYVEEEGEEQKPIATQAVNGKIERESVEEKGYGRCDDEERKSRCTCSQLN